MNLKNAARKAVETLFRHGVDLDCIDPLFVLQKLRNVALIAYDHDLPQIAQNNHAFTLVNKKGGDLQYIVLYNKSLPAARLRLALAKQLGHVILRHDGADPEEDWTEEASCFAHHFLFPFMQTKRINYIPNKGNILWEMKSIRAFDSVEALKIYVAEERNRFNRFIGIESNFGTEDVEFVRPAHDRLTGWKNCHEIILDGATVGFCGE